MLLRRVRPKTPPEVTRKAVAWDLVREIRGIDTRLEGITAQMIQALNEYPSRLLEVDGIGPVLAVRLIGRCRRASRFPNADAFASYAGVAPVEVSSGERAVHRLVEKRRPEAELGAAPGRRYPGPHAQQRPTPVLRPQDQRGQDPQSSNEMPQTQDRISCLAAHAHRRTLPTQRQQTPSKGGLTNTHTRRVCSAGAGLTLLVTGLWCLCHDLSTWPPPGLLNRGAG